MEKITIIVDAVADGILALAGFMLTLAAAVGLCLGAVALLVWAADNAARTLGTIPPVAAVVILLVPLTLAAGWKLYRGRS